MKQRIITGIVLVLGLLLAMFGLSDEQFSWVLLLILLLAGWEWGNLLQLSTVAGRVIYCIMLLGLSLLLNLLIMQPVLVAGFLTVLALVWLGVPLVLWRYSRGLIDIKQGLPMEMAGLILLSGTYLALAVLHQRSAATLLFSMVIVWGADTGAYFVGRRYGKHKLAPSISPGKSREGALAALATGLLIGVLGLYMLDVSWQHSVPFILLTVATVVISIVGDLFESMLKRQTGLKDSGRILPGHGGILDRIDSLIAAAPFFAAGLYWIGL